MPTTVARLISSSNPERRTTMNAIIPIVLVLTIVLPVAVMLIGGLFISAEEDAKFERDERVTRELQEYLDKKYEKDLAKCRTKEDYEKLERAVENGDYIAPNLYAFNN